MVRGAALVAALAAAGVSAVASVRQPANAAPQLQTLFQSDYNAYPTCYRQPVLLVVNSSHLIAFVEGRNNTWCSGTNDGSPSSIRLKTSSDGGASWTPTEQVLWTGGVDFLSAVYDKDIGRAFLLIQYGSTVLLTTSDDAGATWTKPAPTAVTAPNGYTDIIPGVAHGIQISGALCAEPTCGGLAGRLVVAFICHSKGAAAAEAAQQRGDVACPGCYSCLVVSDDHGSTWRVGAIADQQDGSREASLAQLPFNSGWPGAGDGSKPIIYASERNMGNATGHRLHAVSVDGGESFTIQDSDYGIPDGKTPNWTGIVAGATRFDSTGPVAAADAPPVQRLVISIPMNRTARQDFGLYTSLDNGHSWNAGALYRAGPAGYSDCAAINATHGGLLFENGDNDAEFDFANRISFGYFTANDL